MKIFFLYSCHLFLIYSASVRSILFLSFIVPIFAWNSPLVSLIFWKRSSVFPILLFSSISLYWSLHWSLRKAFLSLAVLWNSAFRWMYLNQCWLAVSIRLKRVSLAMPFSVEKTSRLQGVMLKSPKSALWKTVLPILFLCFWPCYVAWGILVPQQGFKPEPLQ